jgi:AbrB family looped-hinge helix DNA binding protein
MTTPRPYSLVTLSAKGQFAIPKPLRVRLGARPGDRLVLTVHRGHLRIARLHQTITQQTAGSLRRFVPKEKLGRPWKEIIETTKRLAVQELAKEGTA